MSFLFFDQLRWNDLCVKPLTNHNTSLSSIQSVIITLMIGWVAFFFLPKEVHMFTMAEVKVSHLIDNLCPCMNALLQSSFRIKGEISHLPPVTALFIPLTLCHHLLPTRFNIIYIIFWGLKIDGFYKSNQLNFRSVSESHRL